MEKSATYASQDSSLSEKVMTFVVSCFFQQQGYFSFSLSYQWCVDFSILSNVQKKKYKSNLNKKR